MSSSRVQPRRRGAGANYARDPCCLRGPNAGLQGGQWWCSSLVVGYEGWRAGGLALSDMVWAGESSRACDAAETQMRGVSRLRLQTATSEVARSNIGNDCSTGRRVRTVPAPA